MSTTIKVDDSFKEILDVFIDKFEEKHGVRISYSQATSIFRKKIDALGGIRV